MMTLDRAHAYVDGYNNDPYYGPICKRQLLDSYFVIYYNCLTTNELTQYMWQEYVRRCEAHDIKPNHDDTSDHLLWLYNFAFATKTLREYRDAARLGNAVDLHLLHDQKYAYCGDLNPLKRGDISMIS